VEVVDGISKAVRLAGSLGGTVIDRLTRQPFSNRLDVVPDGREPLTRETWSGSRSGGNFLGL